MVSLASSNLQQKHFSFLNNNSILRLDASVLLLDRSGDGWNRAALDEGCPLLDRFFELLSAIRSLAEGDAVNALHRVARERAFEVGKGYVPGAVLFNFAELKLKATGLLDERGKILLGLIDGN